MKRMVDKKEYVSPKDKFKGLIGTREGNLFLSSCYFEYDGTSIDGLPLTQMVATPNLPQSIDIGSRDDFWQAVYESGLTGTIILYRGIGIDTNNVAKQLTLSINTSTEKFSFQWGSNYILTDFDDEKFTTLGIDFTDLSNGYELLIEE